MHVVTKKLAFLDLTQSTEGFALQIIISQLKLMFIVILGVIQIFIVILGVIATGKNYNKWISNIPSSKYYKSMYDDTKVDDKSIR